MFVGVHNRPNKPYKFQHYLPSAATGSMNYSGIGLPPIAEGVGREASHKPQAFATAKNFPQLRKINAWHRGMSIPFPQWRKRTRRVRSLQ